MLRQGQHRTAREDGGRRLSAVAGATGQRRGLLHPAAGWFALAVLYLVAVVLNVLLAVSTGNVWPLVLAALLAAAAAACAAAAVRSLR